LKKQKDKSSKITLVQDDMGNHNIHGFASPGSYGEYLLLKKRYQRRDLDWLIKYMAKGKQLVFNTGFLEESLKAYGELHCEYCGKRNLKIYAWYQRPNRDIMATADHFFPKSADKENLSFEIKNMVVCCDACNTIKADKIWDFETIKFPYPETLNKLKQLYNASTKIFRLYARRPRNSSN
jgi:5-methylcytosine-specific restriction endonuclease McrA